MPNTPYEPPALEKGTLRVTPLGGLGESVPSGWGLVVFRGILFVRSGVEGFPPVIESRLRKVLESKS